MTARRASDLLRDSVQRLREAGVENPAIDARVLLAHSLHLPPERLSLHLGDPLPDGAEDAFWHRIEARIRRQPISQIIGHRLFWGRTFRVTPDVLDPRPDTECLVQAALTLPFRTVLDLGTGTGCILLTLLLERPGTSGMGVEVSPQALSVAKANRRDHAMQGPMELRLGSWYEPVTQQFDLIVSNPPYIALAEMPHLAPEVRDHEPHIALTPGGDGLDAYRAIVSGAPAHLKPGGTLLLEIGPTQAPAVKALLAAQGFAGLTVLKDLDGRDRVVKASRPEERT